MDENSVYFQVNNTSDFFILNDRIEINWFEILIYPTGIFLFLFLSTGNLLATIPVTILVAFIYTLFRYFSWFFYTEFIINKTDGSVNLIKKRLNTTYSTTPIDKVFEFNKIIFIKHERSGKDKYLLTYQTYKTFEIMVIKSMKHKDFIENELKCIFEKQID